MPVHEQLIFEYSHAGRGAREQWPHDPGAAALADLPANLRRVRPPELPEVGELETERHFTRLSQLNFSIDTHFYPLGSCTMKYNPKACNQYAMLPEFLARHPLGPESHGQGLLACLYELQEMLKEVTGMQGVALNPMAGAHGEFAGVAMIRAYHRARGDLKRNEIIVPEAAHGTNPATATMCGCVVREIPVDAQGDVELTALAAAVGPNTAGIMLTNPSTLGVFERHIGEVARIVHQAGGLLYYDGANLNAYGIGAPTPSSIRSRAPRRPSLEWSPDSRKIAVARIERRCRLAQFCVPRGLTGTARSPPPNGGEQRQAQSQQDPAKLGAQSLGLTSLPCARPRRHPPPPSAIRRARSW